MNCSGFVNNQGIKSNRILHFVLCNEVINGGKKDLFYQSQFVNWNIGLLKNLKFNILIDDDTIMKGTLSNELSIQFSLKYE